MIARSTWSRRRQRSGSIPAGGSTLAVIITSLAESDYLSFQRVLGAKQYSVSISPVFDRPCVFLSANPECAAKWLRCMLVMHYFTCTEVLHDTYLTYGCNRSD